MPRMAPERQRSVDRSWRGWAIKKSRLFFGNEKPEFGKLSWLCRRWLCVSAGADAVHRQKKAANAAVFKSHPWAICSACRPIRGIRRRGNQSSEMTSTRGRPVICARPFFWLSVQTRQIPDSQKKKDPGLSFFPHLFFGPRCLASVAHDGVGLAGRVWRHRGRRAIRCGLGRRALCGRARPRPLFPGCRRCSRSAIYRPPPPKSRAKGSPDRPRRSAAAAARPAPRGAGPAPRTIQRMHATRTVWTKEQRRPPQDRTGQAPTQPQSRAQAETGDGRVHRACFLVDLLFFPLVARARHRQGRQRKETVPLCATIQPCLHVLRGPCKRFLRRARTRGPAGEGAMTRTTRRREALGLLFCK